MRFYASPAVKVFFTSTSTFPSFPPPNLRSNLTQMPTQSCMTLFLLLVLMLCLFLQVFFPAPCLQFPISRFRLTPGHLTLFHFYFLYPRLRNLSLTRTPSYPEWCHGWPMANWWYWTSWAVMRSFKIQCQQFGGSWVAIISKFKQWKKLPPNFFYFFYPRQKVQMTGKKSRKLPIFPRASTNKIAQFVWSSVFFPSTIPISL